MSNLTQNPIGTRDQQPVSWRRAEKDETQSALRLILGTAWELASDEQVLDFLRFAMYRGIDLADLWIAERHGRILWAILPVVSAGRTMLMFSPPHVAPTVQQSVAPILIERVLGHFSGHEIQLAQVLADPGDESVIALYSSVGFTRLADLLYLGRDLRRVEEPPIAPGLHWENYGPARHQLFTETIVRTYEGSLDCPSLNGMRDIQDVMAGHKAVGQFDPKLWVVMCEGDRPLGVSLLNRSPHSEQVELVYFGLVPEARGHGLADVLMRHALCASLQANCKQITLAVDSDNAPAVKLYRRHGLKEIC